MIEFKISAIYTYKQTRRGNNKNQIYIKIMILQQNVELFCYKLELCTTLLYMRYCKSVWRATNPLFFMLSSKNNLERDIITWRGI